MYVVHFVLNNCYRDKCLFLVSAGDLMTSLPTNLGTREKVKEQMGASPSEKVSLSIFI